MENGQTPQKSDKIRLVITLDPETGQMWIAGPTHNKLLCAHMIADAFKTIMDAKGRVVSLVGGNG
jgi:hypothetical protein